VLAHPEFLWYNDYWSDEKYFLEVDMTVVRIILTIIFILICIALAVLVLLQEGKSAGLGSISGAAETYWGKNKGRSMEGTLVKITKYLAVGFLLLALILNLNAF
jgi:preprotein translocase subunit SecG